MLAACKDCKTVMVMSQEKGDRVICRLFSLLASARFRRKSILNKTAKRRTIMKPSSSNYAAKVAQKRVENTRGADQGLVTVSAEKTSGHASAAAQLVVTPRQAAKARTHQKIHVLAVKPYSIGRLKSQTAQTEEENQCFTAGGAGVTGNG